MNKLLLAYVSFVISCLLVITAFITATTYLQLTVAILLYPVLIFFGYKVLPLRIKRQISAEPSSDLEMSAGENTDLSDSGESNKGIVGISDIDKRVFLKLIGGAGIFLFFFSIFNKKAEGLFFKNVPSAVAGKIALEDIAGNKIDPAQNQPTDGYKITEIEDDLISFYGYTHKDGGWFVMRIDTDKGSFRYAKGDTNFTGNWDNRASLSYDYYNNTF